MLETSQMNRRVCAFVLGLAGALTPSARASAQTPPAAPVPPLVAPRPEPAPAPSGPPPIEAQTPSPSEPNPPLAAPPPGPPPPVSPPEPLPAAPVPGTVPTTWGPTLPDESVVETGAPGPVARPRLSAAVGLGFSFDSVGFNDNAHALPAFFTVLGIGDGPFGFDLSAFASSARREDRMSSSPLDRLAVDAFGVVRPGIWYRPDDRRFNARVVHSLAAELGLGLERDGRSAISATRFLVHTGARLDLPLSPASEPTEVRLRFAVRRGIGLYTPKLYGTSASDVTNVTDSAAELYVALVVVF